MPYTPHTDADIAAMLETVGVKNIEALFDEVPQSLQTNDFKGIAPGQSEMRTMQEMEARAERDNGQLCFIGAGAYEHHIPAAVWEVVGRGEWMTAYTPYQAEASQGTLQLIYEYQTMLCGLTAMDVSNASLYDGASALAESILMAVRAHRKSRSKKFLMPKLVHPYYREVCHNIVANQGVEIVELPISASGSIELQQLVPFEGEDITALILPLPNFFGALEDVHGLTDWAHNNGQLVIAAVNPIALAMLTPPGEWGQKGADIVVGEGQPLGVPLASGGPYFGFMCCKQAYVRQMPGRIIGRTVDKEGHTGFALTLQAREQHIRRSKATSNICTNQGLAVTAATIYMSLLGPEGLHRVAQCSRGNTLELKAMLSRIEGVSFVFEQSHFHEFVFVTPKPAEVLLATMAEKQIQAGVALSSVYQQDDFAVGSVAYEQWGNAVLVCVTETKSTEQLQQYVDLLQEVLND